MNCSDERFHVRVEAASGANMHRVAKTNQAATRTFSLRVTCLEVVVWRIIAAFTVDTKPANEPPLKTSWSVSCMRNSLSKAMLLLQRKMSPRVPA